MEHKVKKEDFASWLINEFDGDKKRARESLEMLGSEINTVFECYNRVERIPRDLIDTQADLDKQSAFMKIYFIEVEQNFKLALKNALASYYSSAFSMLRNVFEAVVIGAACEYLAHNDYRSNTKCIDKNLIARIDAISKNDKGKMEDSSFHVLSIVHKFLIQQKIRFHIKNLIEALQHWGGIDPYSDSNEIYKVYSDLSGYNHQYPFLLDTSQRAIDFDFEGMYKVRPMKGNLQDFCAVSNKILDISIVIELNIIKAIQTIQNPDKIIIRNQLKIITDKNLPLPHSKILLSQLLGRYE